LSLHATFIQTLQRGETQFQLKISIRNLKSFNPSSFHIETSWFRLHIVHARLASDLTTSFLVFFSPVSTAVYLHHPASKDLPLGGLTLLHRHPGYSAYLPLLHRLFLHNRLSPIAIPARYNVPIRHFSLLIVLRSCFNHASRPVSSAAITSTSASTSTCRPM
jgi:hypothetical protein